MAPLALQHGSLDGLAHHGLDGGCTIICNMGGVTLCRWLVWCCGYVDGFGFGAGLVDAKWSASRVGFAFCRHRFGHRGIRDWCLGPVDHVA